MRRKKERGKGEEGETSGLISNSIVFVVLTSVSGYWNEKKK